MIAKLPNISGGYKIIPGMFFLHGKENNWITCRDIFHDRFGYFSKSFFFSHADNNNLHKIIEDVENKLNLRRKTIITKTQNSTVSRIRVAPFWLRQKMRLSLFTLICRAHSLYDGDLLNAARKERYLRATIYPFKLFLSGRTRYRGFGGNWYDTFSRYNCASNEENICALCDKNIKKSLGKGFLFW